MEKKIGIRIMLEIGEDEKMKELILDSDYDGTEPVWNLKSSLGLLKIENPAKTFAIRMKSGGFEEVPEDLVVKEAEFVNYIADAWESKPELNVLSLVRNLLWMLAKQGEKNDFRMIGPEWEEV